MNCPKCGTECAEKAAFCDWCGERLHGNSTNSLYSVKEYYFLKALGDYWDKALDFNGRARRKEFWFACLWNFGFLLLINAVGTIVSKDLRFALELVFFAAVFVPNISLAMRRVHDLGKCGYWLFVGLIPFIGHIVLAVVFALDGTKEGNRYGESTKYVKRTDF